MKKYLVLFVTFLLLIGLSGCQKKPKDDIYIFFTSDVHCGVDENVTFPALKALVDDTKAEHENVLLVDCGDYIQGGNIGALSRGEMIVELMNDMGYDLATYGNHEFDYGMERLSELTKMMKFQTIASNVKYSGNKENIFKDVPEYVIKDFDGVKVAFLGLLTPNTIVSSTPKFFMEDNKFVYDFYSGNDGMEMANKVQSIVDEVRKQGADYVVAISHLGTNTEKEGVYNSISLISHTSGIDVVLDGHSHAMIVGDVYPNKDGKDVLLSSVGTKLEAVGELIISKEGEISTVHFNEYSRSDETIQKSIDNVKDELDVILSEVIGETAFDLTVTDEEGIRMVRTRETNLGDFVADAFREVLGTDVAVINGGAVRKTVKEGKITFGDLLNITPFFNKGCVYKVTGQMILDALEYCSKETEAIYKLDGKAVGEFGAFLQVSGLKYTINTSIPSAVTVDEKGMFNGFSSDARRVSDVMVLENGEYVPIDPQKEYTLGSADYLVENAGDGNTAFKNSEKIDDPGIYDSNVTEMFLKKNPQVADHYKVPEGRITIK